MDENHRSKVREPTRQQFISLGGVVGLLLGGEEDFEDGDFEGEDQEGLGLADSMWADNSQIRIITDPPIVVLCKNHFPFVQLLSEALAPENHHM